MMGREYRDYKVIIHSKRWHTLREAYIYAHPLCEECLKKGILDSVATEVHHKQPIGTGRTFADKQRLAFDPGNLESLCHECHKKIHQGMYRESSKRQRTHRKDVLDFLLEKFDI